MQGAAIPPKDRFAAIGPGLKLAPFKALTRSEAEFRTKSIEAATLAHPRPN